MQEYDDIVSLAQAITQGGEHVPDNADPDRVSEVASDIATRLFIEISTVEEDDSSTDEERSEKMQYLVTDAIACGYLVAKLEDSYATPLSFINEEIIRKLLSEGSVTITLGVE